MREIKLCHRRQLKTFGKGGVSQCYWGFSEFLAVAEIVLGIFLILFFINTAE